MPNAAKLIPGAKSDPKQYEKTDKRRENKRFYDSAAWKNFRKWFLRQPENVICCVCKRAPSTDVDHVKPRHDYPELALDETNCRGKCKRCHGLTGSKSTGTRKSGE
jgi:5-methylcytosine-specific restriction endonuclease McrA